MSIISLLALSISTIYVILIVYIYQGWKTSKITTTDINTDICISILLPVRNEAKYIRQCIDSILNNHFPLDRFEIIVIDDHSEDDTLEVVRSISHPNILIISLDDSSYGKKAAITYGVSVAKFSLILSTDADCVVGDKWLQIHAKSYTNGSIKISTGLVMPMINQTLISKFQWLDFTATMAITANGIQRSQYFLANGANISYLKSAFEKVNGFKGNEQYASGDDLFLVQKIVETERNSVQFIKNTEAIVFTKPEANWQAFVKQRKRWATKSVAVGDPGIVSIQIFIFLYSLLIIGGISLGVFFSKSLFQAAMLAIMIKMVTDYIFLYLIARFFEQSKLMNWFFISFFVYFIHILLSGWFAVFPTDFEWKSRSLK